jgi:hypothetical protein
MAAEIQRLAAVGAFAALDDGVAKTFLELLEGHLDLAGVEDVAETWPCRRPWPSSTTAFTASPRSFLEE